MRHFTLLLFAMVVCEGVGFCRADEMGTCTPLVAAAASGRLAEVKALLEQGADPNPPKIDGGFTPYEAAVWNEQPEVAAYLAAHGANTNQAMLPPPGVVSGAVWDENQRLIAEALVELRPVVEATTKQRPYSPLTTTDSQGLFRFVHQKTGTYLVNVRGNHPGREVVVTEAVPVVENVMLSVTQAESRSQNLLDALQYGHLERIQSLLEAGANPDARDEYGTPALVRAAAAGNLDVVNKLIAAGAARDAQDAQGQTAIDRATLESREDVIAFLLDQGAPPSTEELPPRGIIRGMVLDEDDKPVPGVDVSLTLAEAQENSSFQSWTETQYDGTFEFGHQSPGSYWVGLTHVSGEKKSAAVKQRTSVADGIELRVTRQAVLNQRFLIAAIVGDLAEMQRLLAEGAEVDMRTDDGETPLMRAAYSANEAVIRALLEVGADVNAKDNDGESVLVKSALGFRWNNQPVSTDSIHLLLSAGADVQAENQAGRSVLWHAIERDHDAMADLLRARGAKEPRAPLPARGVIGGVVLDDNGKPVPGATVDSARIGEIGKPKFSGFHYDLVAADETGRFEFRKLEAGIYQIRSGNLSDPPQEIAIESRTARATNWVLHSSPKIEAGQDMIRAAMRGDSEKVKACLAAGADVDAVDRHTKMTALQKVASDRNPEIVQILLDAGANTDPATETRRPALVLAANRGNLAIVRILVKAGVNLEAKDFRGRTAMDEAVWNEYENVAAYLAEKGAQPSTLGSRPLGVIRGIVLDENDVPIEGVSIQVQADRKLDGSNYVGGSIYSLRSDSNGVFSCAGLAPAVYQVRLSGARSDMKEVTLADQKAVVENVRLRISLKDERDQNLIQASIVEDKEGMARLIAEGASLAARDGNGNTAFSSALRYNKQQAARILAAAGADVDVRDSDDRTPLMYHSRYWKLEIIRLLLELGADPNARDLKGESPLTQATRRNAIWRKATEAEMPDRVDERGIPCIHQSECPECVRLLLDAHADTEVRNVAGRTPLIECAMGGRLASVQLLLDAGANVNAQDEESHSALWHALKQGHSEVAALLREHRAKEPDNPSDIPKKRVGPANEF